MSNPKKYSDDDIARLAGLITEQFEDQLAKVVETIDARIQFAVTPLREGMESLEASQATMTLAIRESNATTQQLDKAVGNVEHQIHSIKTLAVDRYFSSKETRTLVKNLETRVSNLETAV